MTAPIDTNHIYAVITGDFIGFSHLPAVLREQAYFLLKDCHWELAAAFPGLMPWEVDMFRGDGWQMLLTDPTMSLRIALLVRAFIRGGFGKTVPGDTPAMDARLAIGVGRVDYVPEGRVSAGDGPAFRVSGKLLERMATPKEGTMRLAMADGGGPAAGLLDGVVRLTGALADAWAPRQALAISGALRGWACKDILGLWPERISKKSVYQRLAKARWTDIAHGLKVFEEGIGACCLGLNGPC